MRTSAFVYPLQSVKAEDKIVYMLDLYSFLVI